MSSRYSVRWEDTIGVAAPSLVVALQPEKPTDEKGVSAVVELPTSGASAIHSAEDCLRPAAPALTVLNLQPSLLERVSVKWPWATETEAVILSPGFTGYCVGARPIDPAGYISHQA